MTSLVVLERQWRRVFISRGSSEKIASANRLVTALASSVESELAKKRAQNRGIVPPRPKKASAPVRPATDAHNSKTELNAVFSVESDNWSPLPSVLDIPLSSGDVEDCQNKLEQAALESTAPEAAGVSSGRAPSVKEYSLFDNHFSRAVESVLKHNIGVSCTRTAFGTQAPAASCPTFDETLLAKAPGYRVLAASPARFLAERPRKYSNDSSSSMSSVRSCEESPSGGRILASHRARSGQQLPSDVTHAAAFRHDLLPVCTTAEFSDFGCAGEVMYTPETAESALVATAGASPHPVSAEQYSSQNEPMTLPRIATDLNPYAPDFVFRPTTQATAADDFTPATDNPVLSISGGFFVPDEMVGMSAEKWREPLLGFSDRGTTAYDISSFDPRQWTVPNTLLQESLSFG